MPKRQGFVRLSSRPFTRRSLVDSPSYQSAPPFAASSGLGRVALLNLCVCAVLLPVAAQNFFAVLVVAGFFGGGGLKRIKGLWRDLAAREVRAQWRLFVWGLVAVWCLLLLVAAVELFRLGYGDPEFRLAASRHLHLIGKTGVYGSCIVMPFLYAGLKGSPFPKRASLIRVSWLLVFASLYALYMLGQRYYGWDVVHGWNARLGDNRFAYGTYRGSGFMGHPLTLAYNALIFSLLTFAQALWLWSRRRREAWQYLALTAVLLAIIVLSGSRYPSVLAVTLYGLGLSLHLHWHLGMKLGRILLVVGGSGVLLLALAMNDAGLYGRFQEFFSANEAWEQRLDRLSFWMTHWQVFLDHPWFGSGYARYDDVLLSTYSARDLAQLERKYNAHNIYLQTLATFGLLGFAALLVFLANYLRLAWSVLRARQHLGLLLMFLGTLCGGFMQNVLHDSEFMFATWFCIGSVMTTLLDPLLQARGDS